VPNVGHARHAKHAKHVSTLCPKAKPQVNDIEKLQGTAKPESEVRTGIKSLSLHVNLR